MNLYIYDDYLKKYGKILNNIEVDLHKLNLNGKIIYLEAIKNLERLLKDELSNDIKTIIAVGNNLTLNKVINAVLKADPNNSLKSLALGIIPVGPNNSLANALGIKNERSAAEIILARRLESLNIAKINETFFLGEAAISAKGTSLSIQDFSINPVEKGEIRLANILLEDKLLKNGRNNPQDGLIDIFVYKKPQRLSFFSSQNLLIQNNNSEKVLVDNCLEVETPAKVEIIDKNINFIIGKDRTF